MSAPTITPSAAAAVIKAANRCSDVLTERLEADPDSPIAEDLRTLIDAAEKIADEYAQHLTERRTA